MATGELATHVLSGNLDAAKAVYEEKSDLIDLNADDIEYEVDNVTKTLKKPLVLAVLEQGNADTLRFLLEKGADVNRFYTGMDPAGPAYFATEFSSPKISEELSLMMLEHADMSLKNSRGQTILFEAQLRNPEYTACLLQKFGVNIAERDHQGHTVVDEVLFHDMYTLMPVYQRYILGLIQANDINTLQNLVLDGFEYVMQGGGVQALDVARENDATDVANFIETVPQLMDTIPTFHSAVGAGNLDGLKAIASEHLSVAKDSGGRCSLHLAVMCEEIEVVKYLVETYPATLKITDNFRRTALHYAAALHNNGDVIYNILVEAGADEKANECNHLNPKEYRMEITSPGYIHTSFDVEGMIEREKTAHYGMRIYLKLQFQALSKAIEANDTSAAQTVIDNLAFGVEEFVNEDITKIPPLFLAIQHGAEDIALYLIQKGADPKASHEGMTVADAAFKAKMSVLYPALAELLSFKPRRLSAFSETSSMMSERVEMPSRPAPIERKVPAGLNDFDSQYLGKVLGEALSNGLTEVCQRRPWDPIEYLAQWLYKFSQNESEKIKKREEDYLLDLERAEAERESIRQKRQNKESKHLRRLDTERQKVIDAENKIKEEEEKKRKELEEIRNKQREMDQFAQPPDLDTVREVEEPSVQVAAVADVEEADGGGSEEQTAEV